MNGLHGLDWIGLDGLDGWMDGWILLNLPEHDQVGHDYLT